MKKTYLLLTYITIAVLSSGTALSGAPAPSAGHVSGPTQRVVSVALFCPGTPRAKVEQALGQPNYKVGNDMYVYLNYRSTKKAVTQAGFNTMLVVFSGERVSLLKFVNEDDLRAQSAAIVDPTILREPLAIIQ